MSMPTGFQHPGHIGPPQPHSQMHPGPMMVPVGGPGGFPGLHYGPHGPLAPGGPMSGAPDRSEHSMAPGQAQIGGPMMQQHHHRLPPPGAMSIQPLGPHQPIPPGSIPPHNHHLHHPVHSQLAMHRCGSQLEFRIYELNRRLQQRADESDSQWWEAFATDFFEDDATLTIIVGLEDGPKHFNIVRTLIPRYFRSIFESGCNELYFNLRHTRESFQNPLLILDSECANMVMNMVRPYPTTVVVEAQFSLGITLDELMRIRSWTFQIRSHREFVVRSMLGVQDPVLFDQVCKNVTRSGIMANTLHFLRLCVILEPMQELMSRQKFQNLSPRECLRSTLFQRWKRITSMQNLPVKIESNRQTNKRRKRKGSSNNSETGGGAGRATKRKQSPIPVPPHNLAQHGDIMVVGEPTLMGGDFGEDDERLITRLENSQYDPAAALAAQHQQLTAMGGPLSQHHHPPVSSGMTPFGRAPTFPPVFPGGQSPIMYTPAPPYVPPIVSSSSALKSNQSPMYGHPNSVPPPHMPYGVGPPGGSVMSASVPPHHAGGGRIMSPMGQVGAGNPPTPHFANATMMFAPPPSLANSEPGGNCGMSQQPPRSSSASSLYIGGCPATSVPAFPPPPMQTQLMQGITPPPALQQQQQQSNGPPIPFHSQKSPILNSPGVSTTISGTLQFPPPLTSHFDPTVCGGGGGPGRTQTPRLHPPNISGHLSEVSAPGSVGHQDGRSGTPNPNGFPGTNVTLLLADATLKPTTNALSSASSSIPSQTAPNGPGSLLPPLSSCQDIESNNYTLPQQSQSEVTTYSLTPNHNELDVSAPPKPLPSNEAGNQGDHSILTTTRSESVGGGAKFLDSTMELFETTGTTGVTADS